VIIYGSEAVLAAVIRRGKRFFILNAASNSSPEN
jgi:hypothetical protein